MYDLTIKGGRDMIGKSMSRRHFLYALLGSGAAAALAACGATPAPAATATAVPPAPTPTAAAPAPTATTAAAAEATATSAPAGETPVPGVTPGLPPEAATVEAAVNSNVIEGFTPKLTNPTEKIELLYWWGNNYQPAMDYTHVILKKFNLVYPNVTVNPVGGQNCDAFVAAAAAGTPPDLFHTWDCVERMGIWAKQKMIIPLDDYIQKDGFDLNDYLPGTADPTKMDGKIWGMVDTGGVFLLWDRPQIMKEVSGSDAVPGDLDQLWALAQKATTRTSSGDIQRLGMAIPNWIWTQFAVMASYGGKVWDYAKDEPTPDDAGVIAALKDLVAQVNFYGVDALDRWSSSIGSQSGEQDPWMSGNMMMKIDGDWSGQAIFDFFPNWQFKVDYGADVLPPAPQAKQTGDPAVVFWTWPLVIPSGTKHPDWSWELLRYMLSPEYQLNVHPKFKEILVRKSLMNDPRVWWPAGKVAAQIAKGGRAMTTMVPMHPVAGEYLTLLGEATEKILHLQMTPEEGMAGVKSEIQAKIKEVMG